MFWGSLLVTYLSPYMKLKLLIPSKFVYLDFFRCYTTLIISKLHFYGVIGHGHSIVTP